MSLAPLTQKLAQNPDWSFMVSASTVATSRVSPLPRLDHRAGSKVGQDMGRHSAGGAAAAHRVGLSQRLSQEKASMTFLSRFDAFHEQAIKITGLSDFGSEEYVVPMLLLADYDKHGQFTPIGEQITAGGMVGLPRSGSTRRWMGSINHASSTFTWAN
jgi:hypothetical protein